MDRVQFPTFARVLRDCRFERFKTLLSVQIDVFLMRINVFPNEINAVLTRSERDSCSDCTSRSTTHNPSKSRKTRAKVGIVRDPYVILPFGLCDRAFSYLV